MKELSLFADLRKTNLLELLLENSIQKTSYALITNPYESRKAAAAADAFRTVKRINNTPLDSAQNNIYKVIH
jgi:hypothetical protein